MSARVSNGGRGLVMVGTRQAKCADIPDLTVLRAIDRISREPWWDGEPPTGRSRWVMRWDLNGAFPAVPPRLMWAKCARLIRRGLLTGCSCGCRGDYELTDAGRSLLAGVSR